MLRRAALAAGRAVARSSNTSSSSSTSGDAAVAGSAPAAAAAWWRSPPLLLASSASAATATAPARAMSAIVDVNRNNVDQAFGRLRRQLQEAGLQEDLRRRRCFTPTADATHARKRSAFNRRMGALIRQRLGWVMRRRKVKV